MNFEKYVSKQSPKVIIAEGVIVLVLIIFLVVYAFGGLKQMQDDVQTYQEYGDRAARLELQQQD